MELPHCNSELLIMAVKEHECLWRERQGWTRTEKERAWEKIGKRFYSVQWQMYSQEIQVQLILKIKRQWTALKYSYNDFKRKLSSNECVKKRKPSYFDALTFLDANSENVHDKTVTDTSQNNLTPNPKPMNQKSHVSDTSTVTNINYAEDKEIALKEHTPSNKGKSLKANEHFLLSLLPDLENMNERQASDFKIGTMTLIRDIMSHNQPPKKVTQRRKVTSNSKGKHLIRKKADAVESTSKTGEITSTKESEIVCIDGDSEEASPTSNHATPAPPMTADTILPATLPPGRCFSGVRNITPWTPAFRPLTLREKLNRL